MLAHPRNICAKVFQNQHRNGPVGANMYRDAQKPDLKGRVAWFLGTKYIPGIMHLCVRVLISEPGTFRDRTD